MLRLTHSSRPIYQRLAARVAAMHTATAARSSSRLTTVRTTTVFASSTCTTPLTSLSLTSSSSPLQPTRSFSSLPDHTVLTMPALSPTMEKGNIASWKKQPGDKVKPGDVLAEVETDKATVAFESVEEGYLAKILIDAGAQDVPVGKPVAILVENAEDAKAFESFSAEANAKPANATPAAAAAAAAPAAAAAAAPAPAAPVAAAATSTDGRVVASPAAKRVGSELGVDLSTVAGTGPNNRIVKADVEEAATRKPAAAVAAAAPVATPAARVAAPAAPATGDFIDIPHSNVRKVIASRLSQSKQTIPHFYLTVEANMDKILKLRTELNNTLAPENKLSVNDFIVKASALACRKIPQVNSSWLDNAVRQYNYVDVSVAVSTDSGLVTPIVKDADIKGLSSIGGEVKALAAKARANKLQPHEFQGGTFTISNLGMFGVKNFSAIINPPQAAILAVGTTETRVVPSGAKNADAPAYTTAQVMSVTLSCDHRVIDGAVGAQWLQVFKGYLENPHTMLL